jgi:putative nucleotidyltransferase with HDIG domain
MRKSSTGPAPEPEAQPENGRAYLLFIPACGLGVLAAALADLYVRPPSLTWLWLALLTILSGCFTVKIPGLVARLSVSEPFVFAAVLWFGPSVGAVTAAIDALVMSMRLMPALRTFHRIVFNLSVLVISIWVSSHLFFFLAGIQPYAPEYDSLADFIIPLYIFTLCCFLLNSGLVAVALSYERRQSAVRIWRQQFLWLSLNYFGGASVAALLVVYGRTIDLAVFLMIVPLLAISYLTFRTALGRLDDATKHLRTLNELYLSTVETLAMAIDAKDQVTHGHIRRVQKQAVALARSLGVTDELQIRAIEAAALLHDMGKLAIPEYILNKPGRLLPSEFEIMKQHASIGADILAAVHFPYPVVPIVRHHHENWDGTGYPDKVKGTDIPIGARILSVVDCFDALTSDRPYRPRLPNDEAMRILLERRGTMYDPLVVDTFVREHARISVIDGDDTASKTLLDTIAHHANKANALVEVSRPQPALGAAAGSSLDVLQSLTRTASGVSIDDLSLLLFHRLRPSLPFSGLALFSVDPSGTALRCAAAAGKGNTGIAHATFQLGDRLSGWVAANRTSVWNSDAALDMGVTEAQRDGLRLCSAIPLIAEHQLVGVLTFYGGQDEEFSLGHRYLLESIAPAVSATVALAITRSVSTCISAESQSMQKALLAILEGALAHRNSGTGAPFVHFVYVKPCSDPRWLFDGVRVGDELESSLATRLPTSAKLFKTGQTSFLVVDHDVQSREQELTAQITEAVSSISRLTRSLHATIEQIAIHSPIELHEAIRLIAPAADSNSSKTGKALH